MSPCVAVCAACAESARADRLGTVEYPKPEVKFRLRSGLMCGIRLRVVIAGALPGLKDMGAREIYGRFSPGGPHGRACGIRRAEICVFLFCGLQTLLPSVSGQGDFMETVQIGRASCRERV